MPPAPVADGGTTAAGAVLWPDGTAGVAFAAGAAGSVGEVEASAEGVAAGAVSLGTFIVPTLA